MKSIKIKRVYEAVSDSDGYCILVDRLWPRGFSKESAKWNEWLKELGPSQELRKWFNHEPEKFPEFEKRYRSELERQKTELKRIKALSEEKQVTLLYGAKDELHNQAVVLKQVIDAM